MAGNLLPILALGAAAILLMKKKGNGNGSNESDGNGSNEDVCPEGQTQIGTRRDGTIICAHPVTLRPGGGPEPSGTPTGPTGFATLDLDVPTPGPEDPYAGQPWTAWPQPVLSNLAGYTCPIGHVLAYRGVMPDGTAGLCGDEEFQGETWCVPPWGAVPYCSWKECEPGLTEVQVVDGNQFRKVCRNIPSS